MEVYLIYMISPVIIAAFFGFKQQNDYKKKKYLIICGMLMALMIGLRHYSNGSGDSQFYYENWNGMSNIDASSLLSALKNIDLEKGYLVTVWALSHVLRNPQFVFVISGVFFAFSICRFVYKNCDDLCLALVMFNCLGLFNFFVQGLRQGVAMCICLFAIEYCKKRKLIPFAFLVFLAMLFHGSAIIFVIVYFIYPMKFNLKSSVVFFLCAFVASKLMDVALDIVNYFMNENYTLIGTTTAEGGDIALIIYVLIILLFMLKSMLKKSDSNNGFYFYVTLLGATAFAMRSLNPIIGRASYYFMFGQMTLLPDGISVFTEKEQKIVKAIVILLCFGISIHKASYSTLIPYSFFWQK